MVPPMMAYLGNNRQVPDLERDNLLRTAGDTRTYHPQTWHPDPRQWEMMGMRNQERGMRAGAFGGFPPGGFSRYVRRKNCTAALIGLIPAGYLPPVREGEGGGEGTRPVRERGGCNISVEHIIAPHHPRIILEYLSSPHATAGDAAGNPSPAAETGRRVLCVAESGCHACRYRQSVRKLGL